ncbi:MAG: DUF86 domain-containing protein [Chloroflexi bacterium]|nr:DUF86 domain-containing protein [Chloroflexota bacterium]
MIDVSQEELETNETIQLAVLHLIQTIGEAAANLSAGFRDAHPSIPWRSMVGARNLIVHRYWEVDLTRIWAIVDVHIPNLITTLEPLIPPDEEQGPRS